MKWQVIPIIVYN